MEITIIHGQLHKGTTYHITDLIKDKIADNNTVVNEYFLPRDAPDFCIGCCKCILKGEENCIEADKVQEILSSMLRSRIIMFDSPTYCCEMSGQLKTLFDHYAYIWMPHRPRKEMFSKIAIAVSTAAGSGANKVTKLIASQLFWWGVPKTYRVHLNVGAACWNDVSEITKEKIIQKADIVSNKVKSQIGNVKPNIKTKFMFNIIRKMQKSNNWNMIDKNYWKNNNWLAKERPWS